MKFLSKFLKDFEQWELHEPSNFWSCTIGRYFIINSFSYVSLSPASEVSCQSQEIVEKFRGGGPSDRIQKMNSDLHRRLEKYFLDWEDRMAYQEKQAEFYKSAMRKKKGNYKIKNDR